MPRLPEPPHIDVELHEDHTARSSCDRGFLKLRRLELRNTYDDGSKSDPYRYDLVERTAIDAVVMALEADGEAGPTILLRSALRPPLAFRAALDPPVAEPKSGPVLWEAPAGLIEQHERGIEGVIACAARETMEETGLEVSVEAFSPLGPAIFLSPGVIAEKIHFVHARVDPSRRGVPTEDGSPVEARASIQFVELRAALALIDEGVVADAKTEIAIRRLAAKRNVRA